VKPDAVAATGRNAALNGMADRTEATVAPLDALDGTFDAIVANVGRAAIVELAPDLVRLLAPGGWLGLSGFPPSQCPLVAGFLRPLVEVDRCSDGDWAALVMARHAGR
jgi:ribosomal protein L11 methyltransferase